MSAEERVAKLERLLARVSQRKNVARPARGAVVAAAAPVPPATAVEQPRAAVPPAAEKRPAPAPVQARAPEPEINFEDDEEEEEESAPDESATLFPSEPPAKAKRVADDREFEPPVSKPPAVPDARSPVGELELNDEVESPVAPPAKPPPARPVAPPPTAAAKPAPTAPADADETERYAAPLPNQAVARVVPLQAAPGPASFASLLRRSLAMKVRR